MALLIDILIEFGDLAALEVGHVDDLDYYRSPIHLTQDRVEYLFAVHPLYVVCQKSGRARKVRRGSIVQKAVHVFKVKASLAYQVARLPLNVLVIPFSLKDLRVLLGSSFFQGAGHLIEAHQGVYVKDLRACP